MFSHGYGSTFFSNDKYVFIASFLIVFLILITMIMIIIRYNHRITDMEALLLINIALGVFGNTTATMAWIPSFNTSYNILKIVSNNLFQNRDG